MALKYPLTTEKSVNSIEGENKIVFVVDKTATKNEIKKEVEDTYKVKVKQVNTSIDRRGKKKAFITLTKESKAADLATKLNLI
ncbi:MAG: 50S ribosomal protein L23 [Candidatus Diapherotrites archaeon]|nr:50S ribosomal protein L23 [Candidatus Diapherotrites archaeon]